MKAKISTQKTKNQIEKTKRTQIMPLDWRLKKRKFAKSKGRNSWEKEKEEPRCTGRMKYSTLNSLEDLRNVKNEREEEASIYRGKEGYLELNGKGSSYKPIMGAPFWKMKGHWKATINSGRLLTCAPRRRTSFTLRAPRTRHAASPYALMNCSSSNAANSSQRFYQSLFQSKRPQGLADRSEPLSLTASALRFTSHRDWGQLMCATWRGPTPAHVIWH